MATQGRARIEVGGRVFVTTMQTMEKAGTDSHLYQTVNPTGQGWFDRDPELFNTLLNVLRTGVKPPEIGSLIIDEAAFYGVEHALQVANSFVTATLPTRDLKIMLL